MRIATTVAPRAVRSIRSGHPWVYDHSILTQKSDPSAGDLAVIFDKNDRFLAIGLADPYSPIAIRILHQGSPKKIDDGFFAQRLSDAIDRRSELLNSEDTTGFRLVNGENDGLPGLVADRYESVVVVKLYTSAWAPHLDAVLTEIERRLTPAAIVVRTSRNIQRLPGHSLPEGEVVRGSLAGPEVHFQENGLQFIADVVNGNKTGHFLDQRQNRKLVGEAADNKSVLDIFSSTGGFSVHAAAGGARSVTSVDISRGAIDSAQRNMQLNHLKPVGGHEAIVGDAFEAMAGLAEAGKTFDLVVVDPPSFAPKQADIERGRASYRRLTDLAVGLLAPRGLLVQASCSSRISVEAFQHDVRQVLDESGLDFDPLIMTGHPPDHPVTFPEGRYLKAAFARRSA